MEAQNRSHFLFYAIPDANRCALLLALLWKSPTLLLYRGLFSDRAGDNPCAPSSQFLFCVPRPSSPSSRPAPKTRSTRRGR
ncbi:hypothetical protein EEQ99_30190 [Rhizobium anhuiense]|uniref:Uncharacterized protein n=1 Tax=Rhizobium anhuiense TaxID=1184720 RepID=A0A432NAM8_9HYPH|nr:hypothetical protein EEQ99_30190 [Rhizobium anhuiense]